MPQKLRALSVCLMAAANLEGLALALAPLGEGSPPLGSSPLGGARDDAGGGAAGAGGGARLVWLPVDHSVRHVPSTWGDMGEIQGRYRGDIGEI